MAFDLPNSLSEACHCFSDPDKALSFQEFRYNHRGTDDFGRMERLTAQIFGRRLTWKDLVG